MTARTKVKEKTYDEMTSAERVAEGRRLVKLGGDIKWDLGDLSLAEVPMAKQGGGRAPEASERVVLLRQFAADIGVEYGTLQGYRTTSKAWVKSTRVDDIPWTVYRELVGANDPKVMLRRLVKEHGKVTVAIAVAAVAAEPRRPGKMGPKPVVELVPEPEPEAPVVAVKAPTAKEKAVEVAALLKDPKVREAFVVDPASNRLVDDMAERALDPDVIKARGLTRKEQKAVDATHIRQVEKIIRQGEADMLVPAYKSWLARLAHLNEVGVDVPAEAVAELGALHHQIGIEIEVLSARAGFDDATSLIGDQT
jgi:hypothetical protein